MMTRLGQNHQLLRCSLSDLVTATSPLSDLSTSRPRPNRHPGWPFLEANFGLRRRTVCGTCAKIALLFLCCRKTQNFGESNEQFDKDPLGSSAKKNLGGHLLKNRVELLSNRLEPWSKKKKKYRIYFLAAWIFCTKPIPVFLGLCLAFSNSLGLPILRTGFSNPFINSWILSSLLPWLKLLGPFSDLS